MISGTGRAGTTFLVRYLTEMGLETHLDLKGDGAWSEEANAGFEDLPVGEPGARLPYVIKSPWACEIIDEVLENPSISLDAVIIPVRDLAEAVSSRVVLERQAIYRNQVGESGFNQSWESWGYTPGGIVFSLNPIDQGRLLAVWFHRLVEQLTRADIPIVLLSFPRLAEDPDYLFNALRTFLPKTTTPEQAHLVHKKLANVTRIRVGRELQNTQSAKVLSTDSLAAYPERAELDQIARHREITRLKDALRQVQAKLELTENESANLIVQVTQRTNQVSDLENELAAQLNRLSQRDHLIAGILSSRSWRVTRPFRTLAEIIGQMRSRRHARARH